MPVTSGSILKNSFTTFGKGLSTFLAVSFIIHLPLIAVGGWLVFTSPGLLLWGAFTVIDLLELLSQLLVAPIAAAALVHGVFRHLRGGTATAAECLRVVASRLGAVLLLGLMVVLTVFAGTLACIIPGIIASVALYVATPALIVEKLSVPGAYKRSWSLTEGYRLTIFGVAFVVGLLATLPELLLELVLADVAPSAAWVVPTRAAVSLLLGVMFAALTAVTAVVTYHDLRVFREGLDEVELAAIFD